MPAALDVNREAVRVLVVTLGVREAARKMNLPESTVQSWSARGKWLAATRPQPATMSKPASMQPATSATNPAIAMQNMLDAEKNPKLLSLLEKREFLASAVRTPIGEIDAKSPLAHKIKRRTDKDGSETEEIESVAKLKALELDAKLAGELDAGNGGDPGLVTVTMVRLELTQGAQSPPAIDV